MISVNLLPEAYRKPKASSIGQFYRSPLAILLACMLVAVWAMLCMALLIRQARYTHLAAQLSQIAPQKIAAEEMRSSVQKLRDEHAVFQRLIHERSQWAGHLNILSDVTPDGVWFTDLSLDQTKGLIVQGSAIARGGEEMVRIGRLVQDLKSDAAFSAIVRNLQIESIKSAQDKEIEIVQFTLAGSLATSASSAR